MATFASSSCRSTASFRVSIRPCAISRSASARLMKRAASPTSRSASLRASRASRSVRDCSANKSLRLSCAFCAAPMRTVARSNNCFSSSKRFNCCNRNAAEDGASSAQARNPSQRQTSPSVLTNRCPGFNKGCKRFPSSASTKPICPIRRPNTSGTDTCCDNAVTPSGNC